MDYRPDYYAKAFASAWRENPKAEEKLTGALAKLLIRQGDIGKLAKIGVELAKLEVKERGGRIVEIATARELSPQKKHSFKDRFAEADILSFRVAPELIAGARITVDGEKEIDETLVRKLQEIF